MDFFYSAEKNILILVALLKAHKVSRIVVSPGTTNVNFVACIQRDSFFKLYSSVDERSAAYIACGLAAESGEPVALSCTGATASRNYASGLTEAYYRKLPVLAITATQHLGRIGHHYPQVIDRREQMNDIVLKSFQIPSVVSPIDEWACNVAINEALLELRHHGGGPIHINLVTTYSEDYSIDKLPEVRVIQRISYGDEFPPIMADKVCIFVGAHKNWDSRLASAVETFCEKYNGIVLTDHTSNYFGKYKVNGSILAVQKQVHLPEFEPPLMIHIGEVSGAYIDVHPNAVWRVNSDGVVRDTFSTLENVFEMEENYFFEKYNELNERITSTEYYKSIISLHNEVFQNIPDLPFSNLWCAQQTILNLPQDCVVHLGILNSLRAWNFFDTSVPHCFFANTGGFGIDGCVSSLLGASLMHQEKIYIGIVGDLAFFYDMNAIGNRHLGNNIRIMVVNNGGGTEFKNYNHKAAKFGDAADDYMAAFGHYGNQSKELLKNYARNLGFDYYQANNKEEFLKYLPIFTMPKQAEKPILFEVFTEQKAESDALYLMHNIMKSPKGMIKNYAKKVLGNNNTSILKKLFR